MAYPQFNKPFDLHVDASGEGLGAILYQRDGLLVLRVVAYASSTLSPAEKTYNMHLGKFEFLAMKRAIADRLRDYLYYAPHFTVYSDNNPLYHVLTTPRLDATRLRWISELADFSVKYKPGPNNTDADGLSHMSLDVAALQTIAPWSKRRTKHTLPSEWWRLAPVISCDDWFHQCAPHQVLFPMYRRGTRSAVKLCGQRKRRMKLYHC